MRVVGVSTIPLIPRKTFFENANALNPRLSPDGRWIAWIAAVRRRHERLDGATR